MNTITEGKYIDLFATYRFLRILTIPWEDQEAFKLGIIDGEGKRIKEKKVTSSEEKDAYTMLHRMVFNFKRILSKIPLVKSKLGTYAAALFLLKEHMREDEYNILVEYLESNRDFSGIGELTEQLTLTEALCLLEEENMNEVTLKKAKRIPAKVSNLGPEGQFALINDFLGIRWYSGIQGFRKDPEKAAKIIKANGISDADVKTALAAMEKEDWFKEDLDVTESINEDAPTNNMGDGHIAKKDNVMKFDGRSKNFKSVMKRIKERKLKEQEKLLKAKLAKWGIKEEVVNEEEYEAFFKKAMKKFKIKDIEDLNDKERVKFFNWVDKNWDASENETD